MKRTLVMSALSLSAIACAQQGKLALRPLPTALAQGNRSVSFRVAEAASQFALGNVALALESYRKALREDPASIDALVGRAACYDAFGRFDLSRRDYEAALALAPADTQLLGLLAGSLRRQGRGVEAATVEGEILSRRALAPVVASVVTAPSVPTPEVAVGTAAVTVTAIRITPTTASPIASTLITLPLPVAREAGPSTLTVSLPVARKVAAASNASVPASIPPIALAPRAPIRLERLSLGEVALVTRAPLGQPGTPAAVEMSGGYLPRISAPSTSLLRSTAIIPSLRSNPQLPALALTRPVTLRRPPAILVLNAARSGGLAGRTRRYLAARGIGPASIGNAPRLLARSIIIAPPADRQRARRLGRIFSITPITRPGTRLTLILGRDALRAPTSRG